MNENEINLSHLAQLMLDWEKAQRRAEELAEAIKDTVLELGETQKVGYVRATYNNGRKTYNYHEAVDGHPMVSEATIKLFTTVPEPRIDWHGICKHVGIDDVPFTQSEPSVTLKLEGK